MPSDDQERAELETQRRRDRDALRLWVQLDHRGVYVPLQVVLEWDARVRADVHGYMLALSDLARDRLERRVLTETPAVLRDYVPPWFGARE